mgnify:CR=1 FL=1
MMKNSLRTIALFLLLAPPAFGQIRSQMSLQEGYELLENNYPALKNAGIEQEVLALSLAQLRRDRLPSIDFATEGRYQSQSVQLETEGTPLPFAIDQPLYSVKSYVEARYLLWDGGMNAAQRTLKEAQLAADQQQIEVSRYGLRQRINQLFLHILLLREQAQRFALSLADLEARKAAVAAGVQQGAVLPGELAQLEVRKLELQAQQADLTHRESGLIATLAQLTGTPLAEDVALTFPDLPEPAQIPVLKRPEQELFALQRRAILAQADLITAGRRPKLSLFAQAGAGAPNPLNLLDSGFAPFGLVGAGFTWKITDWKKAQTDRDLLALQAQKVSNQQATFDFNVESQAANYLAALRRLRAQIASDEEIARLQGEILAQAAAQLDAGTLTAHEYVNHVNAELRARQNLAIHKTELLQVQLECWNERGGL